MFILLVDLCSTHNIDVKVRFITGKGSNLRKVDIHKRCSVLGEEKSSKLLALHALSGADWGGKFLGITKMK